MARVTVCMIALGVLINVCPCRGQQPLSDRQWTIYIANDNCPDYTWGFSEPQTRQALADIVKAHLDEMQRTDGMSSDDLDRYNMAVTQEALCFVERYPARKDELIRRIKEGRIYVSPYLCNSLWALQSAEGMIRTFYPYRRLEREWGISTDCAHHIELPSLPWGVPTILSGCGLRNLTMPYLDYDCTFRDLEVPPVFWHVGPDGSRMRVALDWWASSRANYTQGAAILRDTPAIAAQWLPHYAGLGDAYPLSAVLACGTHGDIHPQSGDQARGFAGSIRDYNAEQGRAARLVNATYPQFWDAVDQTQSAAQTLATVRGSFGHAWDVWPVSLAKYAAASREGERSLLAAETLLAITSAERWGLDDATREELRQAEWCWAMLSDHAWNGTGEDNQRHNAQLRRQWSEELQRRAQQLLHRAWSAAGLQPSDQHVTLVPRDAFCWRTDLDVPAFEAIGNDQNYREVTKDQDGVTDFRFRYSLVAHAGSYDGAAAVGFATSVHTPLLCTPGRCPQGVAPRWSVSVDPRRAVATCLKPADDPAAGGVILRLWEIAGESGSTVVRTRGMRRAILADLLERDQRDVPLEGQQIRVPLMPHGYCAVRLLP